MMIQVSRNGEVLGSYSRDEIGQKITQGLFEPTDHFWREGMVEWKPLTTLDFYIPKEAGNPVPQSQPVVQQTDIGHYVEKTRKLKVRGALMLIGGIIVAFIGAANQSNAIMGIGTVLLFTGFVSFMLGRSRQ